MDKRLYALAALIIGALFGIIGDWLFYNKALGLNAPLYVLLLVIALFGMQRLTRQPSLWRNWWLLIPLGFFAVMIAIRADLTITFLNIAAVLGLAALIAHYFPLADAFDRDSIFQHATAIIETGVITLFMPIEQIARSLSWMREHQVLRTRGMASVARGGLIALPVVVVFAVLLASADEMFAQYINRLFAAIQINSLEEVVTHGGVIGFLGWIVCGGLAYAVLTRPKRRYVQVGDQPAQEVEPDAEPAAAPKGKKRMFTLNTVESGIVLGSVAGLFGVFVLIQFTYFFGGQSNISLEGFTYAEYARGGFFELVTVSVLTLGLMLWLDYVTVRHTTPQQIVFRALALSIVALTGVMLWSAHLRLSLYEQAYGFSHLRLYPHVFMFWLAALYVFFGLTLFRARENIFSLGVIVCSIGFLATLNVIDVDATIMRENVGRYHAGLGFDLGYLRYVSEDAIPVLLPLYDETDDPELKTGLGQWLRRRYNDLERWNSTRTLFSAHSGRETAWSLLNAAEGRLPEYDPAYFLPTYSRSGYRE